MRVDATMPQADAGAPRTVGGRIARLTTEILAPAVLAAGMPLVLGVHATGRLGTGLAWGALTALFSSVIPYGCIRIGMIAGKITDHHIGVREQRRIPFLLALISVVAGAFLLVALDAPRELVAMVGVMLAVLIGVAVVNQVWKLSAHAAVASGSATVLVAVYGLALLAVAPLVALVCWSRVRLRDHTTAQVITGAALGVPLAAGAFLLLR